MRFEMLAAGVVIGMVTIASGQIAGKVTLLGEPPDIPELKGMQTIPQCAQMHKDPVYDDSVLVSDANEIANVIVFIDPGKDKTLPGPKKETLAVLDQKGCMYTPHVLAVQVGQPVLVKNSDPLMHNVHAVCIDNTPFNIAQVNVKEDKIAPFTAKERFKIQCDVHGWMKVVVQVFDHPYFATSDEKGKYTIDTRGLPDGTYTIKAWHEVFHESKPQQIEVKAGKAAGAVDFQYQSGKKKK